MPLYPDLSSAPIIGMDIETYDPMLESLGNGVYRRDGNILGVSFSVDGYAEYYNLRHPGITVEERTANELYIKDVLALNVPKVGANIVYDIDWLETWAGWTVNGRLHDVQYAEPLLDEYRGEYSLESLAQAYLGKGKSVSSIEQFNFKNGWKEKAIKNLYRTPYDIVRSYAIDDADDARLILAKQLVELEKQSLIPLYEMEIGLIRPLLKMRRQGVRINEKLRDEYIVKLHRQQDILQARFDATYGRTNVSSGVQLAPLFDSLNILYPLKAKTGNASFEKDWLLTVEHQIAKDIIAIREIKQCLSTFFEGAFTRACVNGRIHGEFTPNKSDEGGTVTGRMSARNPNLQQVTSPDRDKNREEPLGRMCREIFLPEEGSEWGKDDYDQIEYRVITHFAAELNAPRAQEMRNRYISDPKTDFHAMAIQWAREIAGVDLSRSRAKNLGFGSAYFMGIPTMMKKFGWPEDEARELNRVYFTAFPFIEPTRRSVVKTGDQRGYVRTPLGRRAHVTAAMRNAKPRPKTYIIFNHLIQGTAADILKASLANAYTAGIMDVLPFHVTVHDEFGFSIAHTKEAHEAARELKHIMETSVKLSVPISVSPEVGPTWGQVEECDLNCWD